MRSVIFVVIAAWIASASPSAAEIHYVDAFDAPGGQTVFNAACVGGCSVAGFSSGLFSFASGDTIDFGYLTIFPYTIGGRGITSSIIGGYKVSYGFQDLATTVSIFAQCSPEPCSVPLAPEVHTHLFPIGSLANAKFGFLALAFAGVIRRKSPAYGLVHHGEAIVSESLIVHRAPLRKPPLGSSATAQR
jgi:hypothetical protein